MNNSKNCLRALRHWSNLPPPFLTHTHTHTCTHTPQTPAPALICKTGPSSPSKELGWHPCTLGLQRSLWEDVSSAPSLPQKRVTWDLLDPWNRTWSPGSVREAEVKPCGAGAETSLKTEAGSPEHRRQSLNPWVGGVGNTCSVVISPDSSVVTPRGWFQDGV